MAASIDELIEHLSRHEGGALGAMPVVIITPDADHRAGVSVDELVAHLRGLSTLPWSDPLRTVAVTTTTGQQLNLDRVLGFDPMTGCVAIEGSAVTK